MYFTLIWSICIQNVQKESFLALLVFDQSSLCDTPPSVVRLAVRPSGRPAVRPSGRLSVNNFLFPYLLCNYISQRPNYGLNLLVPWSSCACAILVQPGPHGAPQGGSDQKGEGSGTPDIGPVKIEISKMQYPSWFWCKYNDIGPKLSFRQRPWTSACNDVIYDVGNM